MSTPDKYANDRYVDDAEYREKKKRRALDRYYGLKAKASAGEPAFPVTAEAYPYPGITLRAYLAAKALQGICANPDCEPEDVKHNAIVAVRNADALLAILTQKKKAV